MAFSVAALEPTSAKHVLAEIDLTVIQDFWASFVAYVWQLDFENTYTSIDSSLIASVATLNITRVGSFLEDGISVTEAGSLGTVITTHQRWYWDQADLRLYINLSNGDEPALHDLRIGGVNGFARTPLVHNSVLYQPRLAAVPSIVKRKDPLFFSKVAFSGGDLVIINNDGAYDTWAEDNDDLYGNPARVLLGFDDDAYSDYRTMFTGFVERATIGPETLTIAIQDKRKQLSQKVPNRILNDSDWPNIKFDKLGLARPLAYGTIKEAPAIPLNELEGSAATTWEFLLADTVHHSIQSIDAVYVDAGSAGLVSVSTISEDLSEGTFELQATVWSVGQEIRVDFTGYETAAGTAITNAIDVIEDLLINYYNIQATSDFYDLTEWAAASAAAPNIGYYIPDPTDISEVIGQISASIPGWFLVLDSGLYTFRIYDATATVAATVTAEELMATPAVTYDPEQVITSVTVAYAKNWSTGAYSRFTDATREVAAFAKYKTYRREEFETLLTTEAAATAYASTILDYFNAVHGTFDATVKMQLAEREINDIIQVYVDRPAATALGVQTVDIVGITKNLDQGTITINGRIT